MTTTDSVNKAGPTLKDLAGSKRKSEPKELFYQKTAKGLHVNATEWTEIDEKTGKERKNTSVQLTRYKYDQATGEKEKIKLNLYAEDLHLLVKLTTALVNEHYIHPEQEIKLD